MSTPTIDAVCVGNAIVDVLCEVDESFVTELGVAKGSMRLVEADVASSIYQMLPQTKEASGGAAANTAFGLARLGGRAAFVGRVATDELGTTFTNDIQKSGVAYDLSPSTSGPPPTA